MAAPLSPWRVQVLEEVERLEARLEAAAGVSAQEAARVRAQLNQARDSASRGRNIFGRFLAWLTGSDLETAWLSIHTARQAFLAVAPPSEVLAQVPELRSKVKRYLKAKDPERTVYEDWLKDMKTEASADPVRARAIREAVDGASDVKHANIRSFRNTLLWLFLLLLATVLLLALPQNNDFLDLCRTDAIAASDDDAADTTEAGEGDTDATPTPTPTSAADNADDDVADESYCPQVAHVEIMGAVGGLIAAATSLRKMPVTGEPYGVRRFQSLLKIPFGALTGLVGVLLLQYELIDGLEALADQGVLVYALVFGFSQQAVTRLIDKRGKALVTGKEEPDPNEPAPE